MITLTDNIDWVKPVFEQYMWHMKQYYQVTDVQAWIDRANKYYELYRTEAERKVYVATSSDELIGFALINNICRFNSGGNAVAEFYITPNNQRKGVGRELSEFVFDQLPGQWEICVTSGNDNAYMFWSKVIAKYTGENYSVKSGDHYDGEAFVFSSA
ncbi:MAG: GNAT family N-acetyltransferase [Candidatus Thiodiazotropha sp.]|jgi:predicted acetyltransferase